MRVSRKLASFISVALLLKTCSAATATTITFSQNINGYTSTVDTMIRQDEPDREFSSVPNIGWDKQPPSNDVQALIRFDDIFGNGANQIPAESIIQSAVLALQFGSGNSGPSELRRMLKSWSGMDTWNTFVDGVQTDDVEAVASFGDAATPTIVGPLSFRIDVTLALRNWTNAPSQNFGWVFIPLNDNGSTINSVEGPIPPMLTVDFVPEPPAFAMAALGILCLCINGSWARRSQRNRPHGRREC